MIIKNRITKGYIKHHPDYVREKMEGVINNANNIMNLQENKVSGFEDETLDSLKAIKKYIDFFIEDYEMSKEIE